MNSDAKKLTLSDFKYIKMVTVGSINPNAMLSDEGREVQAVYLNRCLNEPPKGVIIGKDIAIGRYMLGEHELTMQKTVYHVGFTRKPAWITEEERKNRNGK